MSNDAVCSRVLQCITVCCHTLRCAAVRCSVLQCVAVCCSVLQRVAVCWGRRYKSRGPTSVSNDAVGCRLLSCSCLWCCWEQFYSSTHAQPDFTFSKSGWNIAPLAFIGRILNLWNILLHMCSVFMQEFTTRLLPQWNFSTRGLYVHFYE